MTTQVNNPTASETEAPIKGLDKNFYLAPAIYEHEKEAIFYRTWQFACHQSELAEPGDHRLVQIADEELIVVRGHDGVIRAFYNVCAHRGHRLLEESGQLERAIVCPYHGWAYDLDGRLRGARRSDEVPGFCKDQVHLSEVLVEVFCGLLFVNLDKDAVPLAEIAADVEPAIRSFIPEIESIRFVDECLAYQDCNWKVSVENYAECYHCQLVHSQSLAKGFVGISDYEVKLFEHTQLHTSTADTGRSSPYNFDPDSGARSGEFMSCFIWPNFAMNCYPGGYIRLGQIAPLAIDRTVYKRRYYRDGRTSDEQVREMMQLHRSTTVAEDLKVVNNVQRGIRSRGYRPGPLILSDRRTGDADNTIHWFQEKIRTALDPG